MAGFLTFGGIFDGWLPKRFIADIWNPELKYPRALREEALEALEAMNERRRRARVEAAPDADADGYVDVPREQWASNPLIDLLPEERQRYWQMRHPQYGSTRAQSVTTGTIKAEVEALTFSRLASAIERLEAALPRPQQAPDEEQRLFVEKFRKGWDGLVDTAIQPAAEEGRGVAPGLTPYHPGVRCETCRHWGPERPHDYFRPCNRITDDKAYTSADGDIGISLAAGPLITKAGFSCTYWEHLENATPVEKES